MADFLVTQLAERLDLSPEEAQAALETLIDDMQADLALGQTVTLPGIGTFRQDITGTQFTPDVGLTDAVNMSFTGLGNLSLDAAGGPIAELSPPATELTDPTAFGLPDESAADTDNTSDSTPESETTESETTESEAAAEETAPEEDLAEAPPAESVPADIADIDDDTAVATEDDLADAAAEVAIEDVVEDADELEDADAAVTMLDDDFPPLPQAEDADSLENLLLPDPFADQPLLEDDPDAVKEALALPEEAEMDEAVAAEIIDEASLAVPDEADTDVEGFNDADRVGGLEPIDTEFEAVDAPEMEAADDGPDDLQGLSFLDAPDDEDEAMDLSFLPGEGADDDADEPDDSWNEPDDEHPLGPAPTEPMEEADFSVMPPPDFDDDEPFDFIEGMGEQDDAEDEQDDFAFPAVPSLEADEGLAPIDEEKSVQRSHPDIPQSASPGILHPEDDDADDEQDRRPLFLIGALAVVLVLVLAFVTYQFVLKEDPPPPLATESPIIQNPTENPESPETQGPATAGDGTGESGPDTDPPSGPETNEPQAFTLPYRGGIDFDAGGWTVVVGSETLYSRAAVRASTFQRFEQPIEILQGQDGGGLTRYRIAIGQFEGASGANAFKRQNAAELPADAWFLRIQSSMRYNPQ